MSAHHRIAAVEGTALPLAGDAIDTDRIIPARYLRSLSFEGLEQHIFEDDRSAALTAGRTAGPHPFDDPRFTGARVLLVHRNFGCGSSREHAPQGLFRWGIRAIIGESFSDIFFGNAGLIGLPCLTAARADVDALMELVNRDPARIVAANIDALTCVSQDFVCRLGMPPNTRDSFVSGTWDTTGMLLDRYEEVRRVASRLPYLAGFTASPPP